MTHSWQDIFYVSLISNYAKTTNFYKKMYVTIFKELICHNRLCLMPKISIFNFLILNFFFFFCNLQKKKKIKLAPYFYRPLITHVGKMLKYLKRSMKIILKHKYFGQNYTKTTHIFKKLHLNLFQDLFLRNRFHSGKHTYL